MQRLTAVLLTVAALLSATPVFAQDAARGPGKVMITIIPGGATFFTEAKDDPNTGSFGNYDLGGAVAMNFNRYVGVEGEISGGIGVAQTIEFGSSTFDGRSPNTLNYIGNLVVFAPNRTSFVPYAAGGVGGMTLFDRTGLTSHGAETFLTGNLGGGVHWHASRWGMRADYRFIAVRSKDDAPAFFGRDQRYGHRVYWGVLLSFRQ